MPSQERLAVSCMTGGNIKKCYERGTCLWGYRIVVLILLVNMPLSVLSVEAKNKQQRSFSVFISEPK